tara:strand:+ start:404 stop:625 length:222 start_codon:yes stop_codon:yes gene_type:complete
MAFEYIIGPVIAALVAIKYGDYKSDIREKAQAALLTQLSQKIELVETETPKKMLATLVPVAKAVQKLNQQVGL